MKLLLIFFFLGLLIQEGISRPKVCSEILSYENNEPACERSSDYIINAETSSYVIGRPTQVTVRGVTPDKTFTNISILAKDDNNKIVGFWTVNSNLLSIGPCGQVVHDSNVIKNLAQAAWYTPSKLNGNIKIQAYISKTDKTSSINCYNLTLTPSTTYEMNKASALSINNVMNSEPRISVGINVTWTFNPGNITRVFMTIVRSKVSEWAAIGLNLNQSMGGTHAFICRRHADNTVDVNRYLNPGNHTPPQPAGPDDGGIFTAERQVFQDGVIYCQFTLSNFSTIIPSKFKSIPPLSQSTSYHPIVAAGPLDAQNNLQWHGPFSRSAFSRYVQLNVTETITFQMVSDHGNSK